jgi:hypothetical protein
LNQGYSANTVKRSRQYIAYMSVLLQKALRMGKKELETKEVFRCCGRENPPKCLGPNC